MGFDGDTINHVYNKTKGYCKYCSKKLSLKNHGKVGSRGAWEIDHSKPKSKGGTDHRKNLVPACVSCNRDKSAKGGSSYKKNFEPKTAGARLAKKLGLPDGVMGSSRRKAYKR